MNHIADSVPSSLLPIPHMSSQTPLPQLLDKPVKILAIHGHGSSSSRAFYKYRALQPIFRHHILQTLHRDVEFHFPNAPVLPAGFEPGMLAWGLADYRVDKVPKLQESVNYLVKYMEEHGPFDGIIGSSAGASVSVALAALLEGRVPPEKPEKTEKFDKSEEPEESEMLQISTTHPPFKFIVAYSGFKLGHPCYKYIYDTKITTPIMHFIGELDTYIPGSLTLQLAQRCTNHRVVYFYGGHYIPRLDRTTEEAARFICDCSVGEKGGNGDWEWVEDGDVYEDWSEVTS